MAKVIHERGKCIGCGLCVSVCSGYWEMGDDGKSNLVGGIESGGERYELVVNEAGCNKEAAGGCPVQCIKVEE